MILSNTEIQKAIDEGRLLIEPEPLPRTTGLDSPYNTTAVDLRLGSRISVPKNGPYTYDLTHGGLAKFLAEQCEHHELTEQRGFTLKPGQFALGITLEKIRLPISADNESLAARIEGKSSFARCGLLVHFTAPTVHAGWEGPLTLEFINLGVNSINMQFKMPICQLILEVVKGVPQPNPSQFHQQVLPAGTKSEG